MSRALGAENRVVDEARSRFSVSGSQIRADAHAHRDLIHPSVYRDLITNVVLVGAPSTGKTTLAEALAETLGTVWMPEYGREYWEEHQDGRRLTGQQLVEIAEGHLAREEEKLLEANEVLVTDTNAVTTFMFALYYHGRAEPRLVELANRAKDRYHLTFLCEDDIPYDATWDRSGEANRAVFQKQIVADLRARRIPFFRLVGPLQARIAEAERIIASVGKYDNLAEAFARR